MTDEPTADEIASLADIDTPTICNLLEMVVPERRGFGFTVQHLHCLYPHMKPIVGFARTATMRAKDPAGWTPDEARSRRDRYLDYVADGDVPKICVVQDVDERPGYGALFGEVNSTVHKALGCLGLVTDGSVRDIDQLAHDFQVLAGLVAPSACLRPRRPVGMRGQHQRHGRAGRRPHPRGPSRCGRRSANGSERCPREPLISWCAARLSYSKRRDAPGRPSMTSRKRGSDRTGSGSEAVRLVVLVPDGTERQVPETTFDSRRANAPVLSQFPDLGEPRADVARIYVQIETSTHSPGPICSIAATICSMRASMRGQDVDNSTSTAICRPARFC